MIGYDPNTFPPSSNESGYPVPYLRKQCIKVFSQLPSAIMTFVVDIADMQNQTDELARQNSSGLYQSASTAKIGQMQGARFRIEGSLTSIVKRVGETKDVYYKFTLMMTDIQSGEIAWMDEKEIRKTEQH